MLGPSTWTSASRCPAVSRATANDVGARGGAGRLVGAGRRALDSRQELREHALACRVALDHRGDGAARLDGAAELREPAVVDVEVAQLRREPRERERLRVAGQDRRPAAPAHAEAAEAG